MAYYRKHTHTHTPPLLLLESIVYSFVKGVHGAPSDSVLMKIVLLMRAVWP